MVPSASDGGGSSSASKNSDDLFAQLLPGRDNPIPRPESTEQSPRRNPEAVRGYPRAAFVFRDGSGRRASQLTTEVIS
ncbi:MAG: hypothetical protein H7145_19185 [Akkermansiaceae bacterium]|nr:hypothetical protein [Armatimonadota bacterium]